MNANDKNEFLKNKLKKIEELPHTADVKYLINADNLNEAFELCGYCFGLTITDLITIEWEELVEFQLNSEDLEGLLYDFITELIFIFDTRNIIVSQFNKLRIIKEDSSYKIVVQGRGQRFDPEIHERRTEIKAMTYSEMEINLDHSDFSKPVSIIVVFDI